MGFLQLPARTVPRQCVAAEAPLLPHHGCTLVGSLLLHPGFLACAKISAPELARASSTRTAAIAAPTRLQQSSGVADTPALEKQGGEYMLRQVLRVETLHRLPNSERPWEEGSEARSSSTAFVVDLQERLIMTTAGAVEHAKRVRVQRVGEDRWHLARVVAVVLDADVALLTVDDSDSMGDGSDEDEDGDDDDLETPLEEEEEEDEHIEEGEGGWEEGEAENDSSEGSSTSGSSDWFGSSSFWSGLQEAQFGELPELREPVQVAGFGIGGESFCVTSGVVSRIEMTEYSHSGRLLLALQVDAPLNNGCWGGPMYDRAGRVLGMAFQKFASQTWMERYDEEGLDDLAHGLGGSDDEEQEEGYGESSMGGGGGGQAPGPEGGEDGADAENVGYAVPALLLRHALQQRRQQQQQQQQHNNERSSQAAAQQSSPVARQRRTRTQAGQPAVLSEHNTANPTTSNAGDASDGASNESHQGSTWLPAPLPAPGVGGLPGMPWLGLRWQGLESSALRSYLGLAPGQTGILVTAVDPEASCAGALQPGDVVTHIGLASPCTPTNPGTQESFNSTVGDTQQAAAGQRVQSGIRLGAGKPARRRRSKGLEGPGVDGEQQPLAAVACDGTILLRPGQRVMFGHAASSGHVGQLLRARVLRGGRPLDLELTLRNPSPLVPTSTGHVRPLYITVAGMVLLQFTVPLMYLREPPSTRTMRTVPWASGTIPIVTALEYGLSLHPGGEQVIVLSELLPGSAAHEGYASNLGASGLRRLRSLNGVPIINMAQLAALIVKLTTESPRNSSSSGGESSGPDRSDDDMHSSSSASGSTGGSAGPRTGVRTSNARSKVSTEKPASSRSRTASSSSVKADSPESSQSRRHDQSSDTTNPQLGSGASAGASTSVVGSSRHSLRFEFSDGSLMVVDARTARRETLQAMAEHGIPHAMSARLRSHLSAEASVGPAASAWPRELAPAGEGTDAAGSMLQRRQKRRRLALRR